MTGNNNNSLNTTNKLGVLQNQNNLFIIKKNLNLPYKLEKKDSKQNLLQPEKKIKEIVINTENKISLK